MKNTLLSQKATTAFAELSQIYNMTRLWFCFTVLVLFLPSFEIKGKQPCAAYHQDIINVSPDHSESDCLIV